MNHQDNNSTLLFAVITMAACMLVTVCVMIIAVLIATQRPNVVIVPIEQSTREVLTTTVPPSDEVEAGEEPFPGLQVTETASLPPLDQPAHSQWDSTPSFTVMTLPQQDAWPVLDTGTVSQVEVRAMTDGNHVDWRLTWDMEQPAALVDSNRFSDAVALQLPMSEGASYMMGDVNQPVYIVYWRAQWQMDADNGIPDVDDYYPSYWYDLYYSTNIDITDSLQNLLDDPLGRQYFTAHAAGNPFSSFERNYPIQELKAEGFGSLSPIPESTAAGNAVWDDGKWNVVFRIPIIDAHPIQETMNNEDLAMFSIAVWDGDAANVGGRKNISVWIPMEFEQ